MRYKEFTEARKNPERNPKAFVNDEVYRELDKVIKSNDKVAGYNDNLFVSFTNVDKLGINPTSKYNTPIGIYAYPAAYVQSKVGTRNMNHLPFAGESEYATIFKAKGNIIDLSMISDREVNDYYKKIAEYWSKVSGKDWKTSVDEVEDIINDAPYNAKMSSYEGGKLWYVTMKVGTMMARGKSREKGTTKPDAISWNKLFREIGVSGCIDNGIGIIHTSEPYQAVFFDISAVSVIKRVYNKFNYNPLEIKHNSGMGADAKTYLSNQYNKFRNMSVTDQEAEALKNPANLRFMTHPASDDLKNAILEKNPSYILYIKNPSEKMKEYAIRQAPSNMQYIKKPSKELQKIAVNLNGNSIKYIIDAKTDPITNKKTISIYPSEEIQQIAVKNGSDAITYILAAKIKPSEAVQQKAVLRSGIAIEQLLNAGIKPSEAVQILAVQHDPSLISNIINAKIVPSDDVITNAGVSWQWVAKMLQSKGMPLSPKLKHAVGINKP